MKYPKEYLDEIKIRLKVSQVVSKSVKLKKRGKEFIGLSPFSNEKTPSFTVNDEKGFYHCFSTTEHGNIFDFVMKTQNLKFGEAVRKLASDAGMPIYKFSKQDVDFKQVDEMIDATGNIGIAPSNPLYALDVNGTVDASHFFVNGNPLQTAFSAGSFWTQKNPRS